MKKIIYTTLLLLLGAVKLQYAQVNFESANVKTDKMMRSIQNREDIVGTSITIALKDSIIYSKGFGVIDRERNIKTQPYHKFRVYSLSKHITAVAAAKLAEEGKLDLDANIKNYLQFIDRKLETITSRQLIGHLSGVRSYQNEEWQRFSNNRCSSPFESMLFFQSDSLISQPGEKYNYTTYGYVILSAVIEKVSGKRFIDYINEDIMEPAGLDKIKLDNPDIVDHLAAKPYEYYKNVMYPARYANNTCKFGGGALLASTQDIINFNIALINNKIIDKKTLSMVLSKMEINNGDYSDYGFGYQLETDKNGNSLA
ncbi:MAG: serine hydrolase domain-containing protein, partial [Bacteroidota bacterium]